MVSDKDEEADKLWPYKYNFAAQWATGFLDKTFKNEHDLRQCLENQFGPYLEKVLKNINVQMPQLILAMENLSEYS